MWLAIVPVKASAITPPQPIVPKESAVTMA
jgi:hypothetical protein